MAMRKQQQYYVTCPYCEGTQRTEVHVTRDYDQTCTHCDRDFAVHVESRPEFHVNAIIHHICTECNSEFRENLQWRRYREMCPACENRRMAKKSES